MREIKIMLNAWYYVEDELLMAMYRKTIEQNFNRKAIEFIFIEIKRRNLKSLIRIK